MFTAAKTTQASLLLRTGLRNAWQRNTSLELGSNGSIFASTKQRMSIFTRRPIQKGGEEGIQARTVSTVSSSSITWQRIALAVKLTRIPLLITAIYTLGYQNGVVETVRNPLKIQQGTFEEICTSFGVTSGKQVSITSEKTKDPTVLGRIGWTRGEQDTEQDERAKRIETIGRPIIGAARIYVRQQLNEAITNAKEKLKDQEEELESVEYMRLLNSDRYVEEWTHALERIEGYTIDGVKNWQYVLIDTPVPNAFVSEMLPQRFFVTTGLFEEFVNNDDELAMILGHEISHLIMGHSSRSNIVEFMFRGLEITLLMLDPTEGMFSLLVASFLGSSREAIVAAHSRKNETEADELGCKLAASSCYNTKRGSKVFLKMHQHDKANGNNTSSLMSTHPASEERYEFVANLVEEENLSKYSQCTTLRKRLGRAFTIAREYK